MLITHLPPLGFITPKMAIVIPTSRLSSGLSGSIGKHLVQFLHTVGAHREERLSLFFYFLVTDFTISSQSCLVNE